MCPIFCTHKRPHANILTNTQKPHLPQCCHNHPFLCLLFNLFHVKPSALKPTLLWFGQIFCHILFSVSFLLCLPCALLCVPSCTSCTYPLSSPHTTSCLIAPTHSRSTHPKKPSRHPVTSLSQPCHKTCMSSNGNYMVVKAWP